MTRTVEKAGAAEGHISKSSKLWPKVMGSRDFCADKSVFLRRNDALNRSKEACHCRNITYGTIEDAIRNGADTLQQVMDVTGAGKGCGKRKVFLE